MLGVQRTLKAQRIDLNDVRIDDANLLSRKEEIIAAVQTANFGALPQRFMGEKP